MIWGASSASLVRLVNWLITLGLYSLNLCSSHSTLLLPIIQYRFTVRTMDRTPPSQLSARSQSCAKPVSRVTGFNALHNTIDAGCVPSYQVWNLLPGKLRECPKLNGPTMWGSLLSVQRRIVELSLIPLKIAFFLKVWYFLFSFPLKYVSNWRTSPSPFYDISNIIN